MIIIAYILWPFYNLIELIQQKTI
ncbi:hypothetical protein DSUL_160081 [Desulfovibrionales bacterium]